jgi:hypothetical protein
METADHEKNHELESLGMSVDEFIELYRTYKDLNQSDEIVIYIETQTILDDGFCATYPNLAVKIYEGLAQDRSAELREIAAINVGRILHIYPERCLELLKKLLLDENTGVSASALDTVGEILHRDDPVWTFKEAAPMLKVYAEELKKDKS